MDLTLKSLSLLLSYPTEALKRELAVIGEVLKRDRRLSRPVGEALWRLMAEMEALDLCDLEERYVALFDRSRTLSLNLFEHVHGESRDRGGAMVSLVETYRAGGFEPATSELPDHLPMLLEFLALRPAAEAQETLADAAHIFAALRERLERRESAYAGIFASLGELSAARVDAAALAELLDRPEDDPLDLAALDAVWEEAEVRFGPDPNAGCPQVRDMLARMDEPTMRHAAKMGGTR